MPIFTEKNGQPLKFFIQRDLSEVVKDSLVDAITAEGGLVDAKVPIKGYVLISPGSQEAERLRTCWGSPDRPDRFFVPYTWVQESRDAGKVLRQIFLIGQEPVKIHIHSSIANLNTRESLRNQIVHAGGDITATAEEASVVLADPERIARDGLGKKFHPRHVESYTWVKKCIDRGIYFRSPSAYKNTGGRRPGDERTAFSEDDEAHLCEWIATVIPFKESGGRTGNKIYQELVARFNEPGYEWVSRHTWQSWRERYKKNSARLDQHIAALVSLNQTGRTPKDHFGYFRLSEKSQKSSGSRRGMIQESGDKVSEDQNIDHKDPESSFMGGTPILQANVVQSQDSEESEWAIREGQAPLPDWARRPVEEQADVDGSKQEKGNASFRTFVLRSTPDVLSNNDTFTPHIVFQNYYTPPINQVPPIDQVINDIANECRFLPAEVRAFYDKSGDLEGTRQRFARLRAIINAMP